MNKKTDIGKLLLYFVLAAVILMLARNSIRLASSVRYTVRPYDMVPRQMYELEYNINDGNFSELIRGVRQNELLKEQPMSDTTEQAAVAAYIEAAFDYRAALEGGKLKRQSSIKSSL